MRCVGEVEYLGGGGTSQVIDAWGMGALSATLVLKGFGGGSVDITQRDYDDSFPHFLLRQLGASSDGYSQAPVTFPITQPELLVAYTTAQHWKLYFWSDWQPARGVCFSWNVSNSLAFPGTASALDRKNLGLGVGVGLWLKSNGPAHFNLGGGGGGDIATALLSTLAAAGAEYVPRGGWLGVPPIYTVEVVNDGPGGITWDVDCLVLLG